MQDRRQQPREKVLYGGVIQTEANGTAKDCVVRNLSETGASVELGNISTFPKGQISLTVARKGRSFLAKIIWWRDNFVGLAFNGETPEPASDLEQRLRRSEAKKRALQQRIKQLLGEG
ncbi:MAG TPA: PilZ domain-containing protein [Bradyrhizobium sp.]|nr:PilZ domain-containing protein [Bradyrhizobium sp.]